MITFTRRKLDKSSPTGFQFEFFCDRCNTSHMTSFQSDPIGVAGALAGTASMFLGRHGVFGRAGQEISHLFRGKSWDDAFEKAVKEAKTFFKQCVRCSGWVCGDTCFTQESSMCRDCAPNLTAEAVAMKSEAARAQMFFNAMDTDQTRGIDLQGNIVTVCPFCNVPGQGGKFCADCGKDISASVFCGGCGEKWPSTARYKFCPKCGDDMVDLFK